MIIDVDKFVASLIKHYCKAYGIDRTSIRCWFDDAFEEQGLEFKNEKIVKTQRRVAAEAKEALYTAEVETGDGGIKAVVTKEVSIKSEDEKIRKEIIDYCHERLNTTYGALPNIETIKRWLAWLEKQGEQESINRKFNDGDIVQYITDTTDRRKIIGVDESSNIYLTEKDFPISFDDEDDWSIAVHAEDVEDALTDKEPKFKVGDWVTNSIETVQITGYDIDYGYQVDYKGNLQHRDTDIIEKEYHLWTIQDAKDGDVLDANGAPFIYKKHDKDYVYFYCGVNLADAFIEATENDIWNSNIKVYPATKDQRDLLFSKMKDAGYAWDSDKKEIRKTCQKPNYCHHEVDETGWTEEYRKAYYDGWNNCNQQHAQLEAQRKPTWSEDDEQFLLVCKNALAKYQTSDKWDASIISQWLENKIKGKVQPKQMYWTEEEIEPIISDYLCGREHYGGMIGRLRCLKPKQKPGWSEEDENHTKDAIYIFNQLKEAKLYEEDDTAEVIINWLISIKKRLK